MPRALVTGVGGQDGILLSRFLLDRGYLVFGLSNKRANPELDNIFLKDRNFHLVLGDLGDSESLFNVINSIRPNEIYNLGAISSVSKSFEEPELTNHINGLGPIRLIENVLKIDSLADTRIFQASSSEQFGNAFDVPQNEATPFRPISPYAISKTYAHEACINFRDRYSLHISCGILFNHESKFRSPKFVTRKITSTAAQISLGLESEIKLGNLEARRDWGYAPEYVQAMWMILQREVPDDYVVATGKSHSLREFLDIAFKHVGLEGKAEDYLKQEVKLLRPNDLYQTVGDASKIQKLIGWENETDLDSLIKKMTDHDLLIQGKKS